MRALGIALVVLGSTLCSWSLLHTAPAVSEISTMHRTAPPPEHQSGGQGK